MLNYTVPKKKKKFIGIDVHETSRKTNADGERKTHIMYFNKYFFLLHRTKKPVTVPSNHVVEHRLVRTDLVDKDGKKVLLEEYAKAHVNPV